MSKKRMMSKQQRLYYEYSNKERVRQELVEMLKQTHEIEKFKTLIQTSKNTWT
jgi:hypothetical protein